jgi:hypothetical protein
LQKFRSAVTEIKELEGGYSYSLPADGEWLVELANLERQCCPFLKFTITAEPAGGPIRMVKAMTYCLLLTDPTRRAERLLIARENYYKLAAPREIQHDEELLRDGFPRTNKLDQLRITLLLRRCRGRLTCYVRFR